MPCDYHINSEDGLVTITGNADVHLTEAIALGRALVADQAFDAELPQLIDLRDLLVDPSSDDKTSFRDFVLEEYQGRIGSLVAVVINDSLDRDSLAALYHLTSRVSQCELFDDYKLALRWLMRHQFAAK